MNLLTKKKKDFAELVEIFVKLSGVTFNENDSREDYVAWKRWCGSISNSLTEEVQKWNSEALDKFKLSDELRDKLNAYYSAIDKNQDNPKMLEKLRAKYKSELAEEQSTIKKLDESFDEEAEFGFVEQFEAIKAPLNVNGAYLDFISLFLK